MTDRLTPEELTEIMATLKRAYPFGSHRLDKVAYEIRRCWAERDVQTDRLTSEQWKGLCDRAFCVAVAGKGLYDDQHVIADLVDAGGNFMRRAEAAEALLLEQGMGADADAQRIEHLEAENERLMGLLRVDSSFLSQLSFTREADGDTLELMAAAKTQVREIEAALAKEPNDD